MVIESIIAVTKRLYRLLIRFYPRQFREQFGEEMMTVFDQQVRQVALYGVRMLLAYWLRELWDWSISCLRAHWREKREKNIEEPAKYRWTKRVSMLMGLLVFGLIFYPYAEVWLEYKLMYPPEQTTCWATSLDSSETAILSMKYEGENKWLPQNPKPHFYITIVDKNRWTLLRETDYKWPQSNWNTSMEYSFARLRQEYAPWMEEVTVNCGLPGTIDAFN